MKNKGGRPRGSKNQPTLFKLKRTKLDTLKLSRECLRIVYDMATGSGIAPQMVLEDLILAGNYTMGPAYDNISNQRKRFREKSLNRKHVTPVTSTEATEGKSNGSDEGLPVEQRRDLEFADQGVEATTPRSDDVNGERGHRPEDNPAFGNASELGDVIGTVGHVVEYPVLPVEGYPDPGPEYVDEDGNPIEPQEVHEEP